MLSPAKYAFALIVLIGLAMASFNVNNYLYDDETTDSVTYSDFTYEGDDYRIVTVAGTDIFLLKNDEVVSDVNEVEDVIYEYYLDTYYPSDDEIDELRGLLETYNESRNDGQKFVGKEEHMCRQVLFIDGRVKYGTTPIYCRNEDDEELCEYAAKLMYQYLSSVTGAPPTASWEDLYDPIREFGFASYGADEIIDDAYTKFESAEDDRGRMYAALSHVDESIDELKDHLEIVEGTMFGWTPEKTCDSDHWCMCPDMDLHDESLEEIEELTEELMEKMEPFANYIGVAGSIANNTADRIAFSEGEQSATSYGASFTSLQARGQDAIALGMEAESHITNPTLSSKLSTLEALDATIPSNIDARDFSSMEADIEQYETLVDDVVELSETALSVYNTTLDAKNNADALLLVLETRELDPFSETELAQLKNDSFDLDATFREGLTPEQWTGLAAEYENVSARATVLLHDQEESPVYNAFLLFRGFARKMNGGISGFVTATDIATPSEVPENKLLAFGGFSLLTLLSFGAIMVLMFLSILVFKRLHVSKMRYVLIAAFVGCFGALLLFSGLLYAYLEKTSVDASVEEYLLDFENRESTAIVVDLRSVTFNDEPMVDCANSLAGIFDSMNKSVTVYELRSGGCDKTVYGQSSYPTGLSSCLDDAAGMESEFLLNYSSTVEEPKFSIIYYNKAEINANTAYYDSCPLTALFN